MYYKVQVATDSLFQDVVWSGLITNGSMTVELKNLQYYTRYYWRVKAIQEMYGNESAWSSYCTFMTAGADTIIKHTAMAIYFLSMKNLDIEKGIKCREIKLSLDNLRIDKNYPVADGACHTLSMNLSDLVGRI